MDAGRYEAWVIYNFLSLCLAWVGGPGEVVTSLQGKMLQPSWHLMTSCFQAIPLDGRFSRRCKQGVLQFVIVKPLLVLAAFVLYYNDKYEEGSFYIGGGYLYITIVYTFCSTWPAGISRLHTRLYIPKFILVKSIVFLTDWQVRTGNLPVLGGWQPQEAADYQSVLICGEMLTAAFAHLYAFPYKDYADANVGGTETNAWQSLFHVVNLIDVVHDTMHQFAPTYHDYVVYSNDTETAPKRCRTRTFVPTEAYCAQRLFGKLVATYGFSAFASHEQVLGDSIRRRFLQEVVPWCLCGEDDKLIEPKLDFYCLSLR